MKKVAAAYTWSLTVDSGVSHTSLFLNVPDSPVKGVAVNVTVKNVSNEIQFPDTLQWALIDKSTGETYTGTMHGFVNGAILAGNSFDATIDFQVPTYSNDFTLTLTSPAGVDPVTWDIRF